MHTSHPNCTVICREPLCVAMLYWCVHVALPGVLNGELKHRFRKKNGQQITIGDYPTELFTHHHPSIIHAYDILSRRRAHGCRLIWLDFKFVGAANRLLFWVYVCLFVSSRKIVTQTEPYFIHSSLIQTRRFYWTIYLEISCTLSRRQTTGGHENLYSYMSVMYMLCLHASIHRWILSYREKVTASRTSPQSPKVPTSSRAPKFIMPTSTRLTYMPKMMCSSS